MQQMAPPARHAKKRRVLGTPAAALQLLRTPQSQRQLNLAWVVDRAGSAVVWGRRAFKEFCGRTSLCRGVEVAEVCRAVNGIKEAHIYGYSKG
jgi:hypothetical protein